MSADGPINQAQRQRIDCLCERFEAAWTSGQRLSMKVTSPPPVIGRYQVVRELGEGGFGTVYLADDPPLRRPVAIKVPRSDKKRCGVVHCLLKPANVILRNGDLQVFLMDFGLALRDDDTAKGELCGSAGYASPAKVSGEGHRVDGRSDLYSLGVMLHELRVLGAFGVAYGALPPRVKDWSAEQRQFLDQSLADLAQEGKIISVRLALFAEMVKSKPWTPATLHQIGGVSGFGVTFLEETFAASTAYRTHQAAVRGVLKLLLPEAGSDIIGHLVSKSALLAASGYATRPRDFDTLLHILDRDLRLITPVDAETSTSSPLPPGEGGRRPGEGLDRPKILPAFVQGSLPCHRSLKLVPRSQRPLAEFMTRRCGLS